MAALRIGALCSSCAVVFASASGTSLFDALAGSGLHASPSVLKGALRKAAAVQVPVVWQLLRPC